MRATGSLIKGSPHKKSIVENETNDQHSSAGPMVAAKQAATDWRVTTAKRIMVIDGGIRIPKRDDIPNNAAICPRG